MVDIYQAPETELVSEQNTSEYGSIEKAINGDYEFSISEVLSEAWSKVSGTKLNFFLCGIVLVLVSIAINFILIIPATLLGMDGPVLSILFQIILTAAIMPISIASGFLGVRVAMGAEFSPSSLFSFYPKTLKLILGYILMSLVIGLGLLLLVIPGIYLAVSYAFALLLMADKDIGIWEALETSRKAVTHRWFSVFVLGILSFLIIFASMFTLFIALIWVVPLLGIAWGILYRNMFGVESNTLALA